ncbi:hypothetical protein MLD38_000575 [Melastoma candidum]|uniref:Uncharacterized protein n=1 Tax=Melastoma candidum TaxID=119954 RepID=A0ACB9SAH1_9MYRT|nr:hypothetical protein MLD38_000575 [Melastoma candidum]
MWSCFLSLTSSTCLGYVITSMGAAGAAVYYLGLTPGLFIAGLFAILILWMYANFWITGTLFVIGGYLFSRSHARLVILMATIYAVYCVKVRVGWHEEKDADILTEEEFSGENGSSGPDNEPESHPCKPTCNQSAPSTITENMKESTSNTSFRQEAHSSGEMKRILNSLDHYDALGLPRHKKIDVVILKREYRKKAMLVHPDKNMGSPLASESFKKLQCAYEVLSDASKKRDYDEQLRKEESRKACQRSFSHQENRDYSAKESRRIQCTKCGHSHVWVCTSRSKTTARWCQDCCQYHAAKDGDGWVEYKGSLAFDKPQRVEIPRAFVCAESKVFDVSEWAMCQGMACRPNTHRPSFHVNMVGLERKTQRSNSSRYPWDLDAEMMDEEEEFEMWLQQALASGLFCETSKRNRKSWSPFKLHQLKNKKQWRRASS